MKEITEVKICRKCSIEKSVKEFSVDKGNSTGYASYCRPCKREYKRNLYANNPEKYRKVARDWARKNKDKRSVYYKEFYARNLEGMRDRVKEYYWNHRQERCVKSLVYAREHKEERKAYEANNREKRRICSEKYNLENPEKVRESNWKSYKKRAGKIAVQNRIRVKQWRKDNPDKLAIWRLLNSDKIAEHQRVRRARKLSVEECFSEVEEDFTRAFWGHKCAICGQGQLTPNKRLPIDHWHPLSKGNALTMLNAVVLCPHHNAIKYNKEPNELFDMAIIADIENKLKCQEEEWILLEKYEEKRKVN